jgi:3-oxoacyl-(acyl-carrier-protein) synthase
MEPKLVITAVGSISCLGNTRDAVAASLAAAPKTGTVQDFGFHKFASPQPCFCADFDPEAILGKKGLRTKDRATKLLLAAVELGFKDMFASVPEDRRPGICIGTAFGSVQSIGDFLSDAIVNGAHNVNPMAFANTVINAPTSNANIRYVSRMSSSTVATTFNAGMDAIIYSCNYIRSGHAQGLLAGGLEEISYYSLAGLAKSGVLCAGQACAAPFGKSSKGILPGEGCAVFYIETENSAKARGAAIIVEIAGMHSCFDPVHGPGGYNPEASGARYCMKQACKQAGIDPAAIGFIAASANGSPAGDAMEASVIRDFMPKTPVVAYKAKTGECMGASGAILPACALTDMGHGRISGTNVRYPLTHDINLLVDPVENKTVEFALINSFSCDGYCASLVLRNRA